MRHGLSRRAVERRLDRFVCVSDFIARHLAVDRRKTAVVHNGVELPSVAPSAHAPVRIGIVGRITLQKQHLVLLEACALLRRGSFELHIIGAKNGTHVREVEAKISALGLTDAVRWIGFVADRDALYGALDIVAAPAIDEPFGLTVPEGGSYGLPVVVARSGAFPELVEDGVNGLMFEPGSAEGCAQALQSLIDDPALRRRLGDAGRARVATEFTIGRMTARFLAALNAESPAVPVLPARVRR
jgi:glycosyltransferase involved in cell wall biosynthesis